MEIQVVFFKSFFDKSIVPWYFYIIKGNGIVVLYKIVYWKVVFLNLEKKLFDMKYIYYLLSHGVTLMIENFNVIARGFSLMPTWVFWIERVKKLMFQHTPLRMLL